MGKLTDAEKIEVIKLYREGMSGITLGKKYGLDPVNILALLKRRGVETRAAGPYKRYEMNEDYFNIINEEKSYWLGFLMADGSIQKNTLKIELNNSDKSHIVKFAKFINTNHIIKATKKNCHYISMTSKRLISKLAELGVVERKSGIIKTPNISKELLPYFYRGYFDGDGWITKRTRINKNNNGMSNSWEIGFSSGSEAMIYEIYTWIKDQLGFNCGTLLHRKRKGKTREQKVYQLIFGGNNLFTKISNLLYHGDISLERKELLFHEATTYMKNHIDGRITRHHRTPAITVPPETQAT